MPIGSERKPIASKHRAREAYRCPLNNELETQPRRILDKKTPRGAAGLDPHGEGSSEVFTFPHNAEAIQMTAG